MVKHNIPLAIVVAKFNHDKEELSRLGKKGAKARKIRKTSKLTLYLSGSKEMSEQAHEGICPVDD